MMETIRMISQDEFDALLHNIGLKEGSGFKNHPLVQMIMKFYDQELSDMCWAIVTTDVISLGLYIKGEFKEFIELSSTELLDCANPDELNSTICYEYSIGKALDFIVKNGAVRECHYRFAPKKSKCMERTEIMEDTKVKIRGYEKLDDNDEIKLCEAVSQYPIAAAIYADKDLFKIKSEIYVPRKIPSREEVRSQTKWRQGIKRERKKLKEQKKPLPPPPADPGCGYHAVVVMDFGYDPKEGKRFWWVKNSSGKNKGMDGYIRVIRKSSLENDDVGSSITRVYRPLF